MSEKQKLVDCITESTFYTLQLRLGVLIDTSKQAADGACLCILLKEKLVQHRCLKITSVQDSKHFSVQETITRCKGLWCYCTLKTEFMALFLCHLFSDILRNSRHAA
jgi:hypothetical protein